MFTLLLMSIVIIIRAYAQRRMDINRRFGPVFPYLLIIFGVVIVTDIMIIKDIMNDIPIDYHMAYIGGPLILIVLIAIIGSKFKN